MSQALLTNYRAFLKSGTLMRAELAKLLKGKQYLPDATINALARVHAECYGAHAVQKESGAWVFYTTNDPEQQTRDNVHEGAKKQWARAIAPHHNYIRKESNGRKKMSAVDRLLTSFENLTLAQQRAFIKSLPRNV